MLQQKQAEDFVIGTGLLHSVEWVLNFVFDRLDLNWKQYVEINPSLLRVREISRFKADITKIKNQLGWSPKTSLEDVLEEMIQHEIKRSSNLIQFKKI
jgi:GDPmannose 4,6-dehydratase